MSLVDRLAGIGDGEKLSVNGFHAMLIELANAEMTKQDIINYWSLDVDEQAELDWLINNYNSQPNAEAKDKYIQLMRELFVLAEAEVNGYTTNSDLVARINRI